MRMSRYDMAEAAAVAAAIVVLVFAYFNAQTMTPRERLSIGITLRDLRAIDSALNRDVLRVHAGLLEHYDPLVDGVSRMRRRLYELKSGPFAIYGRGIEGLDDAVDVYAAVENERMGLIERYKSSHAILRNSIRYIAAIAADAESAARRASIDDRLAAAVEEVVKSVMVFELSETPENRADTVMATADLALLVEQGDIENEQLGMLVEHARSIVSHSSVDHELLRRILTPATHRYNQLVNDRFFRWIVKNDKKAGAFRNATYFVLATLVLYIISLVIRLAGAKRSLEQHAEKVRKALEAEREHNEMQRQFVSMVSHEFRTPLTIIDGSAQRILRRLDRVTTADLEERMGKVRAAVSRMQELIESTLNAARTDAGITTLNLRPSNIRLLLRELCGRQREISPKHVIEMDFDALPDEIVADARQLDHVFSNLLSNAVKYSPDQPVIRVTGRLAGENVAISVSDSGVGIPEEDMPKMFSRFFRASTSAGIAGTGIGLHLVKTLVEMHQGRIDLDSKVGEGSTFTVVLPVDGPVVDEAEVPADQPIEPVASAA